MQYPMTGLYSFTLSVLLLIWSASVCAESSVIDPSLSSKLAIMDTDEEISVIITLSDQQNLQQFRSADKKTRKANIAKALRNKALKSQSALRKYLDQKNIKKLHPFWIFNGIAATLPASLIAELSMLPGIQNISPNRTLTLSSLPSSESSPPKWNLDAINAPAIWKMGYRGSGIVIASMDTGVDYLHPELGPRWRGGSNSWFDPHTLSTIPYDNYSVSPEYRGHGTKTMGVMVGGDESGSSIGVAPDASWIAFKLFNDDGLTTDSIIHQGFQWLLDPDNDPDTDDAPDIVNNSWGFGELANTCYNEFQNDIEVLKAAGIAVVFSAGNEGPNSLTSVSPANYPQNISVGSINQNLQVADHSSRGPSACDASIFPQIVSPGVSIKTTDLSLGGFPNSYTYVTGTSIAAPHISGAMALMLNAAPHLSVSELESAIIQSAVDLGDVGPDNDYGNGLLDVLAAYNYFDSYSLHVSNGGNGNGRITSDALGIDCPTDCHNDYIDGRIVTLTAIASPDSSFTGWSGDCSGADNTCQVTVDQSTKVTANFYSFPWQLFTPIFSKK